MQLNNSVFNWRGVLLSGKYRTFRHVFFIVFFLFFFLPFENDTFSKGHLYSGILDFTSMIWASYFIMYILIPRYLLNEKMSLFFISLLLTAIFFFILISLGDHLIHKYIDPKVKSIFPITFKKFWIRVLYYSFSFIVIIALPIAVKIIQYWLKNLEELNLLQKLNFENELKILKNQVSPHFLFNTLNNINILIENEPKLASKLIHNLSDFLRYQIYKSSGDLVSIKSDISFIENFLFVESLRKDDFQFNINVTGDAADILVPPLLFIPFVENSVKHINQEKPVLNLKFHLENDNLQFSCVNSMNSINNPGNKDGGIGLTNIRKRLQLLFPNNHCLQIEEKDNLFIVKLNIKI